MSTEGKRALIASVRRIVVAGLILLAVWLVLLSLRGAIPESIITKINSNPDINVSSDSASWEWNRSLNTGKPLSEVIGNRLTLTLQLIGLTGLFSLILAGILLFIGVIISRFTERPSWLARLRSILRIVLVSSGAGIPVFGISLFFLLMNWQWHIPGDSAWAVFYQSFFCSLLPAWMLVQTGHGLLSQKEEVTTYPELIKDTGIRLVIRLLKLIGLIIVVTAVAGMGNLLISSIFTLDFPTVFRIAWIFVVIVTLVKLISELIEIAYNHFSKNRQLPQEVEKENNLRFAIPKGWLIFSLVLIGIFIITALFAPFLAPYHPNEIHIMDSLKPPSGTYLLGTDALGRDILSRLLHAVRLDLLIGLACAVVISILATGWAAFASYFRKMNNWIGDYCEDMVLLIRDIICAFPWLVLILLALSISEFTVTSVAAICGLAMLPRAFSMIMEAYHSHPSGKDRLRVILLSIPSVFIFTTAGIIFYIATLSYWGLGVPPPTTELGSMVSDTGRQYLLQAPWIAQGAVITLSLLLTTLVMTGDALLERLGFRSKAVWSKSME